MPIPLLLNVAGVGYVRSSLIILMGSNPLVADATPSGLAIENENNNAPCYQGALLFSVLTMLSCR